MECMLPVGHLGVQTGDHTILKKGWKHDFCNLEDELNLKGMIQHAQKYRTVRRLFLQSVACKFNWFQTSDNIFKSLRKATKYPSSIIIRNTLRTSARFVMFKLLVLPDRRSTGRGPRCRALSCPVGSCCLSTWAAPRAPSPSYCSPKRGTGRNIETN